MDTLRTIAIKATPETIAQIEAFIASLDDPQIPVDDGTLAEYLEMKVPNMLGWAAYPRESSSRGLDEELLR